MNQLIKVIEAALEFTRSKKGAVFFLTLVLMSGCASAPKKGDQVVPEPKKETRGPDSTESKTPFLVGPHTKLLISVYHEPEMTEEVMVAQDGTIDYSYVGRIEVNGLTLEQIEEKLTKVLKKDYLVYPQVKVSVMEFGQIYVFGLVRNPGLVRLKKEISALDAVVEAGGFSSDAKRDVLEVVRMEKGEKKVYRLSLREVKGGSLELPQSLRLLPEDTLVVR